MKKRIVLIVVLCMLTVLFAACSKEEKKDDEAVVTGTETSPTATEDGTKEAEISPTVTEEITKEPEISPAVTEEPEKNPAVTEEITEVPDENSGSNGEDDITKPADGTEENPDPDTETTPDPILTENSDELVADYYKITFLDMGYSRETVEQFLKAYENYGIFPMVIIVKEDGEASLISMGEEDEPLELKYDDRFFFSEDEDAKMLYIFKNDIFSLNKIIVTIINNAGAK